MDIANQVLVLFFLMLTGFVCAKLKITGPVISGYFSSFIVKITLPAMLFTSFLRPFSRELLHEAGLAFFMSIIIYGLSFLIAFVYPRILGMKGPERGAHRYAIIISNCGFIGYPMVEAILGPSFIFHAVIFNIPFSVLAFSICAWLISKEGKQPLRISWKLFVNPSVVATFLGLVFFIFSIGLPDTLYRGIKMTGDITSTLCMIVIGTNLAQANIKQVFGRWQVYVTAAFRLIVLPFLAGFIYYLLGLRGPIFIMAVLITAMPAGTSTSIFASLYDTAPEEASSLVFLSTMLCMVTVPIVVFIAGLFA